MLRLASLGSGSKGNGMLLQCDDTILMVDCGYPLEETLSRLQAKGVDAAQISAILVTHEHGDHMCGVPLLSKHAGIPVYLTPGTARARKLDHALPLNFIEPRKSFTIGAVEIYPVAVPHDAREPVQYVFRAESKKVGVLTDIGSLTPHVREQYHGCDALMLESNYCPDMLTAGPYSPKLKKRIRGNWGHLSNQQAAKLLGEIYTDNMQYLVASHISETNNTPGRAALELDPVVMASTHVTYARQDTGFDWLTVQ